MTPEEETKALAVYVERLAELGFANESIELFAGPLSEEMTEAYRSAYRSPAPAGGSALAALSVNAGQDVNDNGVVAVSPVRLDSGWAVSSGGVRFSGSPDRVRVTAMVHQDAEVVNAQRAAPALCVERSNNEGRSWVRVSPWAATGYLRDTTGHDESSNTIAWVDPTPGATPLYRLVSRQESVIGSVIRAVGGSLTLEAVPS